MSRSASMDLRRNTISELRRLKEEKNRLRNVKPQSNLPTQRQFYVLNFMRQFLLEKGLPPTIREIGEAIGVSSPNGVMCHVRALQRKGLVRSAGYGQSRNWMPTVDEGCCPVCSRKLD